MTTSPNILSLVPSTHTGYVNFFGGYRAWM